MSTQKITFQDRVRGCLVGGAVGDALGYAVEFMSYRRIVKKYGPQGITRYELTNGVAEISDDTQMTLFTANAMTNARSQSGTPSTAHLTDCLEQAYIEWYHTQNSCGIGDRDATCWLSREPRMYSCRAPGNTCMSALRDLAHGKTTRNNSKGCGGIMRVAPIALSPAARQEAFGDVTRIACESARLTHKHPLGYLPAGLMACVILHVMLEDGPAGRDILETAIREAFADLDRAYPAQIAGPEIREYIDELRTNTDKAMALASGDIPDAEAIPRLGEGWTGDEAWYIAVYCTCRHPESFEDAVIAAVNHSGDSDSTGAICGNLMGALLGYDAIPGHFINNLELLDIIEKAASDLING